MEPIDICADCGVRDRALCGSLTNAELATLNGIGRKRRLSRGETVMWAGEESAVCANLVSGVLKVTAATADGREQTVGLLYPADFVGRPYAEAVDTTVTALTDAELCVFPRGPFEQALQDHARMERLLLQRTLAALDEARRRMLVLARKSAREKVAGFLLDMGTRSGGCRPSAGGPVTFDLPLSRGEIAEVLGLTIETVSRQLHGMKEAGLIALPGARAVTLRDPGEVTRWAEAGRRLAPSAS